MLNSLLELIGGVGTSLWGLLSSVSGFAWELLVWLHVESPRLEGLLVGILLAWLLARRDQHPLLRAASAPLKLVLDILDLAWDQVVEVVGDLYGTAKDWTLGSLGWCKDKLKGAYSATLGWLSGLKGKLSKKEE
tara:strand:- start:92 stop:493 length:402 start_codon:yes stop_codon:yes gene_type:complete